MDDDIQLIDNEPQLKALCERLSSKPWLALDTEFLREKTYHPKLCLIQVASDDEIACIDPLSIGDLDCFNARLTNPGITKVFHSASQDMETLLHDLGVLPTPLFDTQIAAALLGQGDQISYAGLVEKLLGKHLPKTQTRTDWSRRPLSSEQLTYAADDVRYLRKIYLMQYSELSENGRLAWVKEDCQALVSAEKYQPQPSAVLRRVKGQHQLPVRQRAVIRQLGLWREQQALKKNLPRKWILADDALLEMAQLPIKSEADLNSTSSVPKKTVERHGTELLKIIAQTRALDDKEITKLVPQQKLSPAQTAQLKQIQKKLADIAAENGLKPSILASRKEIEHLIQLDNDIPLMRGWRYELAGREIEAMLSQERQGEN